MLFFYILYVVTHTDTHTHTHANIHSQLTMFFFPFSLSFILSLVLFAYFTLCYNKSTQTSCAYASLYPNRHLTGYGGSVRRTIIVCIAFASSSVRRLFVYGYPFPILYAIAHTRTKNLKLKRSSIYLCGRDGA